MTDNEDSSPEAIQRRKEKALLRMERCIPVLCEKYGIEVPLMPADKLDRYVRCRMVLEQLAERFPDAEFREEAQEHIANMRAMQATN